MPSLRRELADGVLTVTLERPQARNALDRELLLDLSRLFRGLAGDATVRAVVLTGADPAFCAGLDLGALREDGFLELAAAPETNPFLAVRECAKPVIGAVNGPAYTGGLELALACDFLVASERARFADTHARIGYLSVQGLSATLAAVAPGLARELSLTAEPVDAERALRTGLVNHVVPHDELLPTARRLASAIAANDPATVEAIKASYRLGLAEQASAWMRRETELGLRWRSGR